MAVRFLDEPESPPGERKGRIRFLDEVAPASATEEQMGASVIETIKNRSGYSMSPVGLLEKVPQMLSNLAGKGGELVAEDIASQGGNPYLSAAAGTLVSMGPDIALSGINPELAAVKAAKIMPLAGNKGVEIAMKAASVGVDLTPVEITGSKTLSLLESVLEKAPFSSSQIQKFRAGQLKTLVQRRESPLAENGPKESIEMIGEQIKNQVDNLFTKETKLRVDTATKLKDSFLSKLGSSETYEEIGMAGQEAIKKASKIRFDRASQLYSQVEEFIDPAMKAVPKKLNEVAREIVAKEGGLPDSLQDSEAIRVVSDLAKGREFTWGELNSIRSRLGSLIADSDPSYGFSKAGQGTKFVSDASAAVYKRLFGALEQDIDDFIDFAGPEAGDALTVARSFYKESKQLFGRSDIQRVLKSDPEKVVNMVFKPGSETEIQMLRKGIGEEAFKPLKKKFVSKILETAENEPLTPGTVTNRLDRYGETLNSIFSKDELKQFDNLVTGLQRAEPQVVTNPFFKGVLNQRPEKVIDYIVQPKNTANVKTVQKELGNYGMEKVREGFLSKILTEEQNGTFSPTKFANKLNQYGDETLKAVFPKDVLDDLKRMGGVSRDLGKAERMAGNPSGTGQTFITATQIGWIVADPISGLIVSITPPLLAKAYLSKTVRGLLVKGVTLPAGSKEAPQIATRLIGYFANRRSDAEGK